MRPALVSSRFLRFGLVGAAGFAVDALVLLSMLRLGAGFYAGRVLSFLAAATFTWALNRRFTFAGSTASAKLSREWSRYLAGALLGGAANYLTYALCVSQSPMFRQLPVLAVAIGSLAGLGINFYVSSRFVFRPPARP